MLIQQATHNNSKRFFPKIVYVTTGSAFFITVVMTLLYVLQPHFLQQLDLKIYDQFLLRSARPDQASSRPLLIDIDEASLARFGQWPWPRYRLAALVDRLGQAGVAAVGLDILLAEKDQTSPVLLRDRMKKDFGLDIAIEGLPAEIEDNDRIFAHVLRQNPAVLGCYFRPQGPIVPAPPFRGPGVAEYLEPNGITAWQTLREARSVALPLADFLECASVGFFNTHIDTDGLLRRVPVLFAFQESVYASLALQTLMLAYDQTTLVLRSGEDGLQSVQCGPFEIPLTPEGSMPVLFRGPSGLYQTISAVDVLENRIDPAVLKDRIVFVGTSATGLVDIRPTPFDAYFAGMEVHAAIVDAILSGRFMEIPPFIAGIQALMIFFTGLACLLLFGLCRSAVALPVGIGSGWAIWQTSQFVFEWGFFVSPLYALLTLLATGVFIIGVRFWHEERQKKVIHHAFRHYVSPEVVGQILKSGKGQAALAGERRELSILFSDIRGFTAMSERLAPEQVVTLLNRYFTPMTLLIRSSQGTVDKFIGDAIMAFWNAPLDIDNHANKAVYSALAMHEALDTLNIELERDYGLTLDIGVGVHTGMAYAGNMGTSDLLTYTAIGDNVNLASRLESLCPVYGVPVVASEDIRKCCQQDFFWRRLDRVRVKGKQQPVRIFHPMRLEQAWKREAEFELYDKALTAWDKGDFLEAGKAFSTLASRWPCFLYDLYVRRCEAFCNTPPRDWDGVWTFTSK